MTEAEYAQTARAAKADLRKAQRAYRELAAQQRDAEDHLLALAALKRAAFDDVQAARRRCEAVGADLGEFRHPHRDRAAAP